jgi:IS30 family transposase
VSVHERPIATDQRLHYDHGEGDTIHRRDGDFVALTGRKNRLLDTRKTQTRTKTVVGRRLINMLAAHGTKTLTVDNDRELYAYRDIAKKQASRSTLLTLMRNGKGVVMRIQMDCHDAISRRAQNVVRSQSSH